MPGVRPVAICVFHHRGRILVARGYDDVKDQRFYRPLGGEIEFGESAADALRREIREELGLEIVQPVQLGVLENRFEFRGRPGHELVFVFDAAFADPGIYANQGVPLFEPGWDGPAHWLNLQEPSPLPVYPAGLTDLLRGSEQLDELYVP